MQTQFVYDSWWGASMPNRALPALSSPLTFCRVTIGSKVPPAKHRRDSHLPAHSCYSNQADACRRFKSEWKFSQFQSTIS